MSGALPVDERARNQCVGEIGENLSIIAPEGVGKTHLIVERIIRVASPQNPHAMEWLPRLVVVTSTKETAEEMRQRARIAIIGSGARGATLAQFNRAFFGTIHDFCGMLLERHGHHLGLPQRLEIVGDEDLDALWRSFLRRGHRRIESVPQASAETLFRCVPMLGVLQLARRAPMLPARDPGKPPAVDVDEVLTFSASGPGAKNVLLGQKLVMRWLDSYRSGEPMVPLPDYPGGGSGFAAAWGAAFRPLRDWLGATSWAVVREMAMAFREHRLSLGLMVTDDQVVVAGQLMRHPEAAATIRAEGWRVILHEAQDADSEQFVVLTEVAREAAASGVWMEGGSGGLAPGRFVMVGDPQQSIYGSWANLECYQSVRRRLAAEGGHERVLTISYRRPSTGFLNAVGPALLDGRDGQVGFVPTQPAGERDRVVRWPVGRGSVKLAAAKNGRTTEAVLIAAEAAEVARRLRESGLGRLSARDWSEVAVLCPRRRWLEVMSGALAAQGFDVQNHAGREILGGSAAYAWFTALVWVMAEPHDGFEIAGVLRDIFGIADADIAEFTCGDGSRLRLVDLEDGPADGSAAAPNKRDPTSDDEGTVAETLCRLAALRAEVARMPLRAAALKIVEATGLRERLGALPRGEWDPGMIESLLVDAVAAEEERLTLGEWAESLRDRFGRTRTCQGVQPGAIQLISYHKAKGLQWDCVVLPFLCRPVRRPSIQYPYLVHFGPSEVPMVAFGPDDLGEKRRDLLRRCEVQEMQRMMYLAITRARRTLVLVDDREIFARRSGSFFECAGFEGGPSAEAFEALPAELPASEVAPAGDAWPEAEVGVGRAAIDWEGAVASAGIFFEHRLPSTMSGSNAVFADAEPESRLLLLSGEDRGGGWDGVVADGAVQYDAWWHALMASLPWSEGMSGWRVCLAAQIGACPDVARGRREFTMFLNSEFVRSFFEREKFFHVEAPFVWRSADDVCVEGVIDLLVWDQSAGRAIVVDWRTNHIADSSVQDLTEQYGPQMATYADAVMALVPGGARPRVEAHLYSTASGQAIRIP